MVLESYTKHTNELKCLLAAALIALDVRTLCKWLFSNIDYENDTCITQFSEEIGVCITGEENRESKLTSEENLFNNLLH
jgi:hypothetical protein